MTDTTTLENWGYTVEATPDSGLFEYTLTGPRGGVVYLVRTNATDFPTYVCWNKNLNPTTVKGNGTWAVVDGKFRPWSTYERLDYMMKQASRG